MRYLTFLTARLDLAAVFLTNAMVCFYAATTYRRSRRSGFIFLAVAGGVFACGAVADLAVRPQFYQLTDNNRIWYSVIIHSMDIVGLASYARGIFLLACENTREELKRTD